MSVAKKIIQGELAKKLVTVLLLRGKDDKGTDMYAYFAIRMDILDDFKKAVKKGITKLEEFGAVIAKGPGLEPSDDIKTIVEKEYGFKHKDIVALDWEANS